MACTPDVREPCHTHEPKPVRTLSKPQQTALFYARNGHVKVHVLISACGPDSSEGATVDHHGTAYWVTRRELPHWNTYKALYRAGVVKLVRPNPDYPYDYVIEPNPEHPLNKPVEVSA